MMYLRYLLLSFMMLVFCQKSYAQNENQKPNVLFIICDDLNDYQGAFGGHPQAKTPHIDKLANSSVQFLNAHSNVPVCQPSRNSMITGVYPHESKDYGWTSLKEQPVLKNNKTIMRLYQENGYLTLGTGKITHSNKDEDWDEWGMPLKNNYGPFYYDGENKKALPTVPKPFAEIGQVFRSFGRLSDVGYSSGKKNEKGFVYSWDNEPMRYVNDEDRDLLQDELHAKWAVKKIRTLEKSGDNQPFFMGVGFVRPHLPMHVPDQYFDLFPIEDIQLEYWKKDDANDTFWSDNFDTDQKGARYFRTLLASYNGDRELAIKSYLQAYLACVAFVDEQVGKVLDALENSKFKDNTIVIFTSDHGWQMGEKNYLFKNSPWEESTRIPMLIKTSEASAGIKVKQPVSLIDLYPTLVELCVLKGNPQKNENAGNLGGYSLKPFLDNQPDQWEGPNGALSVIGNYGINIPTEKQNFSYRTKNWRYIRYSNGAEELYNHQTDSYELDNLANDAICKKIKLKLIKEMESLINN